MAHSPADFSLELGGAKRDGLAAPAPFLNLLAELGESVERKLVALLEGAQGFADDLAGGLVAAALDPSINELFELGGKRDVHVGKYKTITGFVKSCY
jgi:hypothetical protein